jgi:hypothetical protein
MIGRKQRSFRVKQLAAGKKQKPAATKGKPAAKGKGKK